MFVQTTKIFRFSGLRYFSSTPIHTPICVIGGGTGGMNFTAQFARQSGILKHQIRVFEPSKLHHYQPAWTMIGAGIARPDQCVAPNEKMFPKGINLTHLAVKEIQPENNLIVTEDGQQYTYEQLIITGGIKNNFETIKGALEALNDPNVPVGTIYHRQYTQKYNKIMNEFKGGRAIFTNPPAPIKCPGAPVKITLLSESHWRKNSVRNNAQIEYHSSLDVIFGVPKYAEILSRLAKEKNIATNYGRKLIEVKGKERIAIFEDNKTKEKYEVQFDLLHLVPQMTTHDFVKNSKGIADATGFVDVDPQTLRHKKYSNIWGLGDSTNIPASKTAAAIIRITPILVDNLLKVWRDRDNNAKLAVYDGYASCPIFVGDKKLLLAEFKYQGVVDQTFGFIQDKPRWIFYWLKKDFFRWVYFNLMPRGIWYGRYGIFKPKLVLKDQVLNLKEPNKLYKV